MKLSKTDPLQIDLKRHHDPSQCQIHNYNSDCNRDRRNKTVCVGQWKSPFWCIKFFIVCFLARLVVTAAKSARFKFQAHNEWSSTFGLIKASSDTIGTWVLGSSTFWETYPSASQKSYLPARVHFLCFLWWSWRAAKLEADPPFEFSKVDTSPLPQSCPTAITPVLSSPRQLYTVKLPCGIMILYV